MFRFLNLATAATLAAAGSAGLRELEEVELVRERLHLQSLSQSQPSAKFAAKWSATNVVAADCIGTITDSVWEVVDSPAAGTLAEFCPSGTPNEDAEAFPELALNQVAPMGRIKIPQNKEILVTLSSQIDIFTINTATSKKQFSDDYYGNIGATSAMAGVSVELWAYPAGCDDPDLEEDEDCGAKECAPGAVTMASRYVELRNRIGGNATYVDCTTDGCETKIADLELESSIGIAMDTAAAHSFQWVCVDMVSDAYDVVAHFTLSAAANDLCGTPQGGDCSTISDLAAARVILGKRMLTVQEVRAVKDSIEALEI